MSISIEQGTFTTNTNDYVLALDASLFPVAQVAPTLVINPLEPGGNYKAFISNFVAVDGQWKATISVSGKVGDEDVTITYRAITRTI